MSIITVENNGPVVVTSNYWESDLAKNGGLFLSPNAGYLRLLMPRQLEREIKEMESGHHVAVSRGIYRGSDAIELLFDDDSDSPYAIHLSAAQCVPLPAAEDDVRDFWFSCWIARNGRPRRVFQRPCGYRIVTKLPWLKPWKEKPGEKN